MKKKPSPEEISAQMKCSTVSHKERIEVQRCDLLKDEKPLGDQESEP